MPISILTTPPTAIRAETRRGTGFQTVIRASVTSGTLVPRAMVPLAISLIGCALMAMGLTVEGQPPDRPAANRPLKLSMDPEQIVLQLSYSGGFRADLPDGFVPTPRLRVYADGRVVTGQNRPEQPVYEIRLDEDQLLDEMARIVNDGKFMELDQVVIAEAIAHTGRPITLVDGSSTRIEVRLDDREHAVELYAPGFCAAAFPEVAGLPEFRHSELVCQRLAALARLGGPERLRACLAPAQESLDAQGAGLRVAAEHLTSATGLPDGGIQVRFSIPSSMGEQGVVVGCVVEVELDAEGAPRSASIFPDEAPPVPPPAPIR